MVPDAHVVGNAKLGTDWMGYVYGDCSVFSLHELMGNTSEPD